MGRTVTVRPDAPHVPPRHQGAEAQVVDDKRLAFGVRWLRVRFEDGWEGWVPEVRTEALEEAAS